MDKDFLLSQLPPSRDEWVKVKDDQDVPDIIREILDSHYANAADYDKIALYFDGQTVQDICDNIYEFEKDSLGYKEESRESQTTALPAGFLTRGYGDCKHFASFAGGVLDGISRLTGKKINWCYRFASYQLLQPVPYHVFVVAFDRGNEYWIDATPGAEGKTPVWIQDERTKKMPLYRQIAGNELETVQAVAETDFSDTPVELVQPIQLLMSLGVLDPLGQFNDARYRFLNTVLPTGKREQLNAAVNILIRANGSTVGNWFDDAFKGIQHFAAGMGMQVPRAAFLGLVDVNAFGLANKLDHAISYPDIKAWLADKWERLGGTYSKLEDTIKHGTTHTVTQVTDINNPDVSVLPPGMYRDADGTIRYSTGAEYIAGAGCCDGGKVGEAIVTAAIISSAAIVIAAIMPVISKLLAAKNADITIPGAPAIDPLTGLPVGVTATTGPLDTVRNFVSTNPVPVMIGAGLLIYFLYENYA